MTAREKEIKDAERKALAEVRGWKRKVAKRLAGMTNEEQLEYWRKNAEELKAKGYNIIYPSQA
jgi:hypothetical protein